MSNGHLDAAYANPRDEVTVLIPDKVRRVLDVGCSVGIMGESLRGRGCSVTGIESVPMLAREARKRLDLIVEADVEKLAADGADLGSTFDCVVLADVLEHLRDPWAVTRWASTLVADGGCLVISVPNIRHLHTFWTLAVRRRWPYRSVGLFDRTHLRWFAFNNLAELLNGTDFEIAELRRSYQLVPRVSRVNSVAPRLGDLGTLQFIFRAERVGNPR